MEDGAMRPRAAEVLGSGVPSLNGREVVDAPTKIPGIKVVSRVMARASSSTCAPDDNTGVCEKPASSATMTLPIVLGVVIPVVVLVCVLFYLHRRNMRKIRMEDAVDPHKSLDFGLGDKGGGGIPKRKSILGMGKDHSKYRQLSMDMNLSSPYLLPPGLQSSRESLHSLAKTLHQNEDPYRPVAQYAASETASIRSARKGHDGASIYTNSTKRPESLNRSHSMATSGTYVATPRQNSFPKSPPQPEPAHMKPEAAIAEDFDASPTLPAKDPFRTPAALTLPDFGSTPYPEEEPAAAVMPASPVIQDPPAAAQKIARRPLEPQSATIMNADADLDHADHDVAHPDVSQSPIGQAETSPDHHTRGSAEHLAIEPLSFDTHPQLPTIPPVATTIIEEPEGYDTHAYPQVQQDGYGHQEYYDEYDGRGRSMQRESMNYQQHDAPGGLGVPEQDTRRLSVGLRPLPPDEYIESEDPETRANRIRSFYKEYFDDSKPDPMPAMPPVDNHQQYHQQHQQQRGAVDYYEDYDQNYYPADAPYYDPGSNAFVMPYAQPVARRAMTPPPSGSRFPGPRGPRGHHGSIGGMSLPGGRGPPRPGSATSSNYGPRPGSSVSNAWGRPRAGSAMSGSRYGGPKKPLPPPSTLSTLPTPSKLRDDSFALLGAIEFAPPETFKDRVAGRSQSPAGERRPYQLNVPIHSPLVNAFDELAALPSPHLLRKSSTFTGLDFAPPRKFQDSDSRSETGSIRSNRSGISAVQLGAIRNGAGRVSRLPEDSIFTTAQMGAKLKPSWTMRD